MINARIIKIDEGFRGSKLATIEFDRLKEASKYHDVAVVEVVDFIEMANRSVQP